MKQNTKEWFIYRSTRIGASDFAKYCATKLKLSKNIFGESFENHLYNKINMINKSNFVFERGHKEEEIIKKDILQNELNMTGKSEVIEYSKNNRIIASLDFRDVFNDVIVEVKTTSKTKESHGDLIEYYLYQGLHQYYCNDNVDYKWTLLIKDLKTNEYYRLDYTNDAFNKLMTKDEWLQHCNDYLKLLDDAIQSKNDEESLSLLDNLFLIRQDLKKLEEEEKLLIEQIKILHKDSKIIGNYTLTYGTRTKKNHKAYVEDNKLPIDDKYITTSITFTINKKE